VLFVSPYPLCPPIHGGGVFMYQTALELTRLCDLHVLILLDYPWQREPHEELERRVSSVEYLVRTEGHEKQFGSVLPHAVREFASQEFEWRLHREMYLREIDVVQLEYTTLSQYGGDYRQLACVVFEHDIYFQSIARGLASVRGLLDKAQATYEYLRALRYELRVLPRFDRVQVCSPDNGNYLLSFVLSRLLLLVIEVGALLGFGALVFHVPLRGSLFVLATLCVLGSLSFSALGLLIASRVRTVEAASGLMNLARNMGGSVGISLVTTMLDRRSQSHQNYLSSHLSASSPALRARLNALGLLVQSHGGGPPGSSAVPYAIIQGAVARQAAMLAYIDCFWFLAVAILAMVPMVFLMKKSKPGGGIAVH